MQRRLGILVWLWLAGMGWGQTRVSLRDQGRDFDFSQASRVRPVPVSSSLPLNCQVGDIRFRTSVTPGQNLYGCAADNTWVPLGSTSVAFDPGLQVSMSSATQLTIGSDCNTEKPCRFRFGSVIHSLESSSQLTIVSGTGQIFVYVKQGGQIGIAMTPSSSMTLNCSGGCTVEPPVSDFPSNSIPLWTWTSNTGTWNSNGGTDMRTILTAGKGLSAGANSMVTETQDSFEVATTNYLPQGTVASGTTLRMGGAVPASDSLLTLGTSLNGGVSAGTFLGMNAPGGYGGDLAHWQVAGTPRFRWTASGDYSGMVSGATATWWGNASASSSSSFRLAIGGTTATEKFMLGTGASTNFLQSNGLNHIGIGSAAPEPGTADVLIQDARPGLGNTQVQIRAGDVQTRDLLQVQDLAGNVLTTVTAQGALQLQPSGSRPVCDATRRGQLWFAAGGAGVADQLQVCIKNTADTYQWNQ